MRGCLFLLILACQSPGQGLTDSDTGTPLPPDPTPTVDTGSEVVTTGPLPCDPQKGLQVLSADVDHPWSEHEVAIDVTLSGEATVAVACTRVGDPDEVHLVEGTTATKTHPLRLAGLLASSEYACRAAAVCPSSDAGPLDFTVTTGAESNPDLPTIHLTVSDPRAGRDYVLTNQQRDGNWNGQRRLVFDRDAQIRWHAAPDAGGSAGGSAVSYSQGSGAFTIAGGWPPTHNGRPQQIALYGSDTLHDVRQDLPGDDTTLFHHDGRQLADGRFMTLEERTVDGRGGGTFRGFGVRITDPITGEVDAEYTSQRGHDEGHLPGGGGDAYHANWADMDDVGGQDVLVVSLCFQGWAVAIDLPSGDWRWTFGKNGDFDLVDRDGGALPDSEYPQCQHGLQKRDDRLLVYDNGVNRGFSRAVEYALDESTMKATKLWDWTEPHWFERSLGGVDWSARGRVLIAMAHIESASPSPGDRSTFVEIDPATGDKLWEAQYGLATDMPFRLQAIAPCALFANAKYCAVVAQRLATLDEVLQTGARAP